MMCRLLAAVLLVIMGSSPLQAQAPSPHLSIADPPAFQRMPPDLLRRRFDLYRQLGIGMLRYSWGWRNLERHEGIWSLPETMPYLRAARAGGFRFKLALGVVDAVPQWFFTSHPDAQLTARDGGHAESEMSLWYPGLRTLLDAELDATVRMLAESGLVDAVAFVVVDLGPGGEPRFPPPWLPGHPHDAADLTYWYYDAHARRDFAATMAAKYRDIGRANAAWHTGFADWDAVAPPAEGRPSPMWADILPWYRDTKRAFITWQIDEMRAKLARYAPGRAPPLMLLAIGTHVTEAEWQDAIKTGRAGASIMMGADTDWEIDLAHAQHLWLQQTGSQSETEIRHIRAYMAERHFDVPIWGENAGGRPALDPQQLADVVERQDLQGLEYIGAQDILQPDGITPSETMEPFARAAARLRQHFGGH